MHNKMAQFLGILIILLLVILLIGTKAGIYYVLAFLIPLFPSFRIRTPGNIPIYFLDILLLIGLIKYLLLALGDSSPRVKNRYGSLLLLLLFSGTVSYLVGFSALGNPFQYSTYSTLRTLLPLTGFLWGFRLFSKDRDFIGKTASIFIASSTLMALLAMGVFFKLDPIVRLTNVLSPMSDSLKDLLTLPELVGRLSFDISPATAAGSFLIVPIFVIACLLASKRRSNARYATFLAIPLTINAIALILTFSRSAIAGFFFGLIIFVTTVPNRSRSTARQTGGKLALVLTVIIALSIGTFVIEKTIERGDPLAMAYKVHFGIQGAEVEYSRESRIDRALSSLHNMINDPLPAVLGSGMGTLMIGERGGANGKELAYTKYYAHDFFLVEMMYWGLLGLVVFLLLIFSQWIRLRQSYSRGYIEDSNDITTTYSILCILPAILLTFFGEIAYASQPALNTLLWFLLGVGSYIATYYGARTVTAESNKKAFMETI
jgi:hypothetical protein